MAGQIAAMSGGQDMGATSAALSAASSIAGIVAQGFQAANAVIDLGQEAWQLVLNILVDLWRIGLGYRELRILNIC